MTHDQLNEYIEHYLDKDKTQSAIMLSGAWGSGKSYYVKHNLIPYLKEKNKVCVVVSLYGIKDLNDISKAIYMELRSIKLFKSNEATETAKIFGKTVLKNISLIVPMLNVNTEISKEDLQGLYESVDLTGKLIIFEDNERSHIDIIEFLGYVNNFVEQDGVKVLLVANESEILKKDVPIDLRNSFEKQEDRFLTDSSKNTDKGTKLNDKPLMPEIVKKYILIKEKTISDTIVFKSDYRNAVKEIINNYDSEHFNKLCNNEFIDLLVDTLNSNDGNLRLFIFACQKTDDIFNKMSDEYNNDFLKCIFAGNVEFIFKFKQCQIPNWDSQEPLSTSFSSNNYPLFKFAYDYITSQKFMCKNDFNRANKAFNDYNLYSRDYGFQTDSDLSIIFNYHINTEVSVLKAIENIENRLKKQDIRLYNYGMLANYLIVISQYLELDLRTCKNYLVENLKEHKNKLIINYLFNRTHTITQTAKNNEYLELKQQMIDALTNQVNIYEIIYTEDGINELCSRIYDQRGNILTNKSFLSSIDIDAFIDVLKNCTAQTIDNMRLMFQSTYSLTNIADFLSSDADAMNKLIKGIEKLISTSPHPQYDRFWLLQLEWLASNLKEYYKKLKEA